MAIRYLSFDFDGCLFNLDYIQSPHLEFKKHLGDAVLVHNRAFLDQLKIENTQFDEVVALIGSNRQSYVDDANNYGFSPSTFKGSCFPAIRTVCADLNVKFDPFLLADVAGNLPFGTSYDLIMQEIADDTYADPKRTHATCTMDETKRTLLFAQMQKAAADHPNEKIIFDFFDDRDDILTWHLYEFYTQHPHMIPKNVTLRLNKYMGSDVTLLASIEGTGESHSDYCEHVNYMLDNLWGHYDFANTLKLISKEHTDSVLENFIKLEEQAIALESSIHKGEHIVEHTETINELGAALASLNLAAQEIESVDDYMDVDENEELATEKEAGVTTNDFSDMSDESSDEDSDLEFFEDNGREKELDAGTDDISDSDLSVDASDEESDLELVEDNGREKEADAGKQTLATEPSTIHARSQAEPANQQRNPAGNPGRNQYAFLKPVAAPKINRAPIALPEDKLCTSGSSCLIS